MSPKTNHLTSTTYSKARFAHPFYLPVPPSARQPINGHTSIIDWSKTQLGPVPPVIKNASLILDDVIGSAGVQEIEQVGELRFHALGDSGVGSAQEAANISDEMATDFSPPAAD